jgi:hypothetical protein
MYRVGERTEQSRRHRQRIVIAIVCVASLILASVYVVSNVQIKPVQTIRNAPAVIKDYKPGDVGRIEVSKPLLTMKLPYGWTEKQVDGGVDPPLYRFQAGPTAPQQLDVYIDNVPPVYAFNKVVAVSSLGQGINYGTVSDNCSTFTDTAKTNPATGYAPAKWQGVDFMCDMGNYTRQVVGTASTEGMNVLTVHGANGKKYRAFFVYTDNNINPDYTTLYAILSSLRFK